MMFGVVGFAGSAAAAITDEQAAAHCQSVRTTGDGIDLGRWYERDADTGVLTISHGSGDLYCYGQPNWVAGLPDGVTYHFPGD